MNDQEFLSRLWENMTKWHHFIILREMLETYGSTEFMAMVREVEKRMGRGLSFKGENWEKPIEDHICPFSELCRKLK